MTPDSLKADETDPIKIEHLVDTDLDDETGEFSYHYNYLIYTFEHRSSVITARSYLGSQEVSILNAHLVEDDERELARIIRYLRARYSKIEKLGRDGYVEI